MFNFCVLASDSSGNAFYVEGGNTKLLFDIGISKKNVEGRLAKISRDIHDIDAIFVSHEHKDHIAGIGTINRQYSIPLFLNEGTYKNSSLAVEEINSVNLFLTGDTIRVGDVLVETFEKLHDAADPVGFIVHYKDKKVGIITDAGCYNPALVEKLKALDAVILESNHDIEMLRNGPYPLFLKQRIAGHLGHISNEDCAKLILDGATTRMQHIILAHLSESNNLPEIALTCAFNAIQQKSALKNTKLYLSSKHEPTELLNIK